MFYVNDYLMNDVYLYWFDILNRILQTCFGEFSAKYHTLYELERAESCNLQILYPIAIPPKNPKFEWNAQLFQNHQY